MDYAAVREASTQQQVSSGHLSRNVCKVVIGVHTSATACMAFTNPLMLLPAAAGDVPKPRSDARGDEKEAYILTKYVRRRYAPLPAALPGGTVHAALWEAAKTGDVRCNQAACSTMVTVCYLSSMIFRVEHTSTLQHRLSSHVTGIYVHKSLLNNLEPNATVSW